MDLMPGRVQLLVAQERDHRDLKRYKLNQIPTERVRVFSSASSGATLGSHVLSLRTT